MARRGKTSPAEDNMDLVAMLPWWVGVMLALVSYLLLHSVASQHVVATAQPGQAGAMVTQGLWKTLASVGQYILPILCLGGAGMSAWRRRVRQNLVTDVAQSKATDGRRYLESSTNGWQFQLFVRPRKDDAYRACGRVALESAEGDRPMSIAWLLQTPLPARLFREFSVLRGFESCKPRAIVGDPKRRGAVKLSAAREHWPSTGDPDAAREGTGAACPEQAYPGGPLRSH